jgi:hypothetical protein
MVNVTVGAGEIGSSSNLTSLDLFDSDNVTVGAGEIGGLINLVHLSLDSLLNVTVGAGEIDLLINLTSLYLISSASVALQSAFPATIEIIRYENNLIQASVDAVLAGIYTDRATYLYATPELDLLGYGNATPSGIYQDADPPTTGLEYKYELINDPEAEGFNKWDITTA